MRYIILYWYEINQLCDVYAFMRDNNFEVTKTVTFKVSQEQINKKGLKTTCSVMVYMLFF